MDDDLIQNKSQFFAANFRVPQLDTVLNGIRSWRLGHPKQELGLKYIQLSVMGLSQDY